MASGLVKQAGSAQQRAAQAAAAGSYSDTLKSKSGGMGKDFQTAGKSLLSGEK
jgi:hypothetical protein